MLNNFPRPLAMPSKDDCSAIKVTQPTDKPNKVKDLQEPKIEERKNAPPTERLSSQYKSNDFQRLLVAPSRDDCQRNKDTQPTNNQKTEKKVQALKEEEKKNAQPAEKLALAGANCLGRGVTQSTLKRGLVVKKEEEREKAPPTKELAPAGLSCLKKGATQSIGKGRPEKVSESTKKEEKEVQELKKEMQKLMQAVQEMKKNMQG